MPSVLTLLTGDLSPASGTPPESLDRARRAVAISEITGQQTGFLTRPSPVKTPAPNAATVQELSMLLTQLRPTQPAPERVVRREFGTLISPDPRVGPTPGAGQAPSSTFGPFLDAFKRPVLIDVFSVTARIGVQLAGAAQPFLYVELPPPTGTGSST
jgi:hypothetical protein